MTWIWCCHALWGFMGGNPNIRSQWFNCWSYDIFICAMKLMELYIVYLLYFVWCASVLILEGSTRQNFCPRSVGTQKNRTKKTGKKIKILKKKGSKDQNFMKTRVIIIEFGQKGGFKTIIHTLIHIGSTLNIHTLIHIGSTLSEHTYPDPYREYPDPYREYPPWTYIPWSIQGVPSLNIHTLIHIGSTLIHIGSTLIHTGSTLLTGFNFLALNQTSHIESNLCGGADVKTLLTSSSSCFGFESGQYSAVNELLIRRM